MIARLPSGRALCGCALLLLLAWGSAAPASAQTIVDGTNSSSTKPYVINSTVPGPVIVNSGGFLNFEPGANVATAGTSGFGLIVNGGTANVSGGTIYGGSTGVDLESGTLNVSGGSISAGSAGNLIGVWVQGGTATLSGGRISSGSPGGDAVVVQGGTATLSGSSIDGISFGVYQSAGTVSITGGSISGGSAGISFGGAALSIYGCSLQLSGSQLTGILENGTPISTPVLGVTAGNLVNLGAPQITCPGNITVPATSASGAVATFTVHATSRCGVPTVVCTNQSGQVVTSGMTFPLGTTTVTCKATDAAGNQSSCSFTITVTPAADLAVTVSGAHLVLPGTNLSYAIVVRNNGPQPAQGVVITDPVPAGTVFASASGSPSVGTLTKPAVGSGGTVTWNVGTLNPGQSVTLTVKVRVTAKSGATIGNAASVSSSTLDPKPANNRATAVTSVVGG